MPNTDDFGARDFVEGSDPCLGTVSYLRTLSLICRRDCNGFGTFLFLKIN